MKPTDKSKRTDFCHYMIRQLENYDFAEILVLSDEATFYLSGQVNGHNARTWGLQKPREFIE